MNPSLPIDSRAACIARDESDPCAEVSRRFADGRQGVLYFDANSVGACPQGIDNALRRVTTEWREMRRGAWSESDWLDAPVRLGDKLAPVIGARPGSVVVGDSTSVNLFKAVSVALRMRPGRHRIITELGTFPTDLYIAQGVAELFPRTEIVYAPSPEAAIEAIDDSVAMVYLSHVDYRTAYRHDMDAVVARAHRHGALTLWDLSHSAGANRIALDATGADLAVGCGYKYLCGGPGAPGFLYVAPDSQSSAIPALSGWMGHADLFAFRPDYEPAPGVARHIVGTPAVIANAVFECALDIWADVNLEAAFAKHAALGDTLISMTERALAPFGVALACPRDAARRGGFVAVSHLQAKAIVAALDAEGVVVSYRLPDVIRFGLSPLYHRFADIWDAVDRFRVVMAEQRWDRADYRSAKST